MAGELIRELAEEPGFDNKTRLLAGIAVNTGTQEAKLKALQAANTLQVDPRFGKQGQGRRVLAAIEQAYRQRHPNFIGSEYKENEVPEQNIGQWGHGQSKEYLDVVHAVIHAVGDGGLYPSERWLHIDYMHPGAAWRMTMVRILRADETGAIARQQMAEPELPIAA
ncbi:MAG TPA: hypothetical protein VLG27_00100 [Candidatus Saccharimonadia bacterium]|nr:hypothetical protein [Candidatus Saccharimonadia bacterium]